MDLQHKKGCYKIRDIDLYQFGRKEIELAHTEMPGLMALRKEYGESKPLQGVKISGSLHMTIQTAVLIETLHHLGAEIRWCSCNIFSTQDHAAAAIAKAGTARVFAWKGESVPQYWWCLNQALSWPNSDGPDLIVDDGGDATLLVHSGVKAEKDYAATGRKPAPSATSDCEERAMAELLANSLDETPQKWSRIAASCKGVSEETTTGVARLRALAKAGELLFPAINVNDAVTKSKFDNVYGCKHSLPDGIKRATDIMIAGKTVVVCGYGDVGKGCAAAMKAEGAKVVVSECDPICALQACMEGFEVAPVEQVAARADIVVTATGNRDVVTLPIMRRLRNNAVVCNIGHFDNEIDTAALYEDPAVRRESIKPQVDRFVFDDGHAVIVLAEGRLVNLGCATGHPSLVMSHSFSNQVLAQLKLWRKRGKAKENRTVSVLPKVLDEKVARLHLPAFGATLTQLSDAQAEYIGVKKRGPFKPDSYRY